MHNIDAFIPQFQGMRDAKVRLIRWFIFCDLRAGVRFGSNNDVQGNCSSKTKALITMELAGVDDWVWRDLDAAIQLAKENNVFLLLAFFDFSAMFKPESISGVQIGGRTSVFADDWRQDLLINNLVIPVLKRTSGEVNVWGYEVSVQKTSSQHTFVR